MNRSICFFKRTKRTIDFKFCNGYGTWLALLCFGLMIQILSLISIYSLQAGYLIQSNRQSQLELACFSQAKHIIENNTWIRRCNGNEENRIEKLDVLMGDINVHFQDEQTYISCTYLKNQKSIEIRLYYDDKSVVGVDYISN